MGDTVGVPLEKDRAGGDHAVLYGIVSYPQGGGVKPTDYVSSDEEELQESRRLDSDTPPSSKAS